MNSNHSNQPPYQPPPAGGFGGGGYGPGAFGPQNFGVMPLPPSNTFATGALVVGVASMLGVMVCGGLGLPIAIGAIVMGTMARRRIRERPAQYTGRGLAIAGLWCGIVGALLNLASLAFFAWVMFHLGR